MDTNSLQRLQGMKLLEFDEIEGSVGLRFDGCTLRGFTSHSSSVELAALVGYCVEAVVFMPGREFAIAFTGGEHLAISLVAADYVGPEAISAQFADGVHVVE